jgi:hypothetical protein
VPEPERRTAAEADGRVGQDSQHRREEALDRRVDIEDSCRSPEPSPGRYLCAGCAATVNTDTGINGLLQMHWGRAEPVWGNTGDTATLRSKTGALADRYTWGGTTPPPPPGTAVCC